jgi:hypothetical protein
MSGYLYVASPFTLYPLGVERAATVVSANTALLLGAGIPAFSPIAHSWAISCASNLNPLDGKFWMDMDRPLMEAAKGLIVLLMDGWDESKGVAEEMAYFKSVHRPIHFMEPGIIPPELLK